MNEKVWKSGENYLEFLQNDWHSFSHKQISESASKDLHGHFIVLSRPIYWLDKISLNCCNELVTEPTNQFPRDASNSSVNETAVIPETHYASLLQVDLA